MTQAVDMLKVSSKSHAQAVASAIVGAVRTSGEVELQAVGAAAVNQAVKGIAIARGFLTQLVCVPSFVDIEIDGEARTAIRLRVIALP